MSLPSSGIYRLLSTYIIQKYIRNCSFWLALLFTALAFCILKVDRSFITIVSDLALRIFPSMFSFSLSPVILLIGLFDKDYIDILHKEKESKNSPYQQIIESFLFYVLLVALSLVLSVFTKFILESQLNIPLNYHLRVSGYKIFGGILIFCYLNTLLYTFDIISATITFTYIQRKLQKIQKINK